MEEVAISVSQVSKSFKLPHERHASLKSSIFSILKGGKRTYERQEVLKNVSFEIKKGEFFGIVGRNGSGKSTLLKLLAGVYSPDKGAIAVNGKLTPFIELGVGFNPELTGRENVFLNGALLGFNRKEMEAMYDEIVAFAELERFMDQRLKNYSSGMQVRLAFSIAIRAQTDVLLLDEVLAVGDESFQRKCYEYFEALKRDNKTVILVSHDMSAVEKFCDNAALVDKGKIVDLGSPKTISEKYSSLNAPTNLDEKLDTLLDIGEQDISKLIESIKVTKTSFKLQDSPVIEITVNNTLVETVKVVCGINLHKTGDPINPCHAEYNSYKELGDSRIRPGERTVFKLRLEHSQLYEGTYVIRPHILDVENDYSYYASKLYEKIKIVGTDVSKSGSFNLQGEWKV